MAPNSESCITLIILSARTSPLVLHQSRIIALKERLEWTPYRSPGQSIALQSLRARGYNHTTLELRPLLLPTSMHTTHKSTLLTHFSDPESETSLLKSPDCPAYTLHHSKSSFACLPISCLSILVLQTFILFYLGFLRPGLTI